ncbi:ATP-binding protein [Streptomyces venezuelae]|uniref:ATP-binding protein n=1 Tax=Streptomyces venezuelae TaxID=54571 RepID=UPI00333136E7
MSTLIEATAVVVPSALALAAGGAAWHLRGSLRTERRKTERLQRHAETLAGQLQDAERVLRQMADDVVPALQAAVVGRGSGDGVTLDLPYGLAGSQVAERVKAVVDSVAWALRQVQYDAETAAGLQISEVAQAADRETAAARNAAEDAAQAAVRSFAASLVATTSRVSRQISEGVRRHADDDAYATLVTIDRLVQQLLLASQSYVILGGGKLSRRWPATSLTDVIHAAMGHLDGFERIKCEESDVGVVSRAVGPTVHALAVLLDNALKYSPKSAAVEVRLLEGHHGVTVRIDDCGLQMNREALVLARRILAGEETETVTRLGAHPRTGFPVAARLAREYGFSVDLEAPNRYRGTSAQIYLPRALLTSVPVGTFEAAAPAALVPARTTTSNGLTVRQRNTAPGPRHSAAPAPSLPGRPDVAAAWASGTRRARQSPTSGEGA